MIANAREPAGMAGMLENSYGVSAIGGDEKLRERTKSASGVKNRGCSDAMHVCCGLKVGRP